MFNCERCGSSYSANHIGVEHCPRCQLRDRVQAPLAFKVFKLPDTQSGMSAGSTSGRSVPPSASFPADAP
jgi:hypothetical protein